MAHLTSSEVAFCIIHVHCSGVSHGTSRAITAARLKLMKDSCSFVSARSFMPVSGSFCAAAFCDISVVANGDLVGEWVAVI